MQEVKVLTGCLSEVTYVPEQTSCEREEPEGSFGYVQRVDPLLDLSVLAPCWGSSSRPDRDHESMLIQCLVMDRSPHWA